VVISAQAVDGGNLIRQLRELGYRGQIVVGNGLTTPHIYPICQRWCDGVLIAQAYSPELDTLSGMSSSAASALAVLTQAEVQILDGATVTTAELNVIDGSTSATATSLSLADRLVVNDAGTMVQVALSDLISFFEDSNASGFSLDGGTF
jgi:hypothetical protein